MDDFADCKLCHGSGCECEPYARNCRCCPDCDGTGIGALPPLVAIGAPLVTLADMDDVAPAQGE